MKMFKDFFNDSENMRGFFEVWESVEPEKLADLIGDYDTEDLKNYDLYVFSKIGFNLASPLLEIVDRRYTNSLYSKQTEIVKLFSLLRYRELLKLKNAMETEIEVQNGTIRTETRDSDIETVDSATSYDSEDFSETDHKDNTEITETSKRMDTGGIVRNINTLTEFYRQSIIDKIIDYIKELYTLNVM